MDSLVQDRRGRIEGIGKRADESRGGTFRNLQGFEVWYPQRPSDPA